MFLGIYVRLVLSLLAAAVVFRLLIVPSVERRASANIEESFSALFPIATERLAEEHERGGDVGQAYAHMAQRFAVPTALLARADVHLEPARAARLDRGEVVDAAGTIHAVLLGRVRGTNLVLQLGPLNPEHPVGGGRAISLAALLLGAMLVGVGFIVRPLKRRLGSLAATTQRFGRGDHSARATAGSRDAVDSLGAAFNGMAEEIQRLIAAQQDLLRSVSHELRTPLQRLHFSLEKAREAPDVTAREAALGRIEVDLDALDGLIDELLTYTRLGNATPPAVTPVEVHGTLATVCREYGDLTGGLALDVRPGAEPTLVVDADARLLRRALANLVGNALKHARSRVVVSAQRVGDAVWLDVDDDGPGVPEAAREAIFRPFLRLDDDAPAARGYGLGLAIVRRIAERHGGAVSVAVSAELGGARFRLIWPGGRGRAGASPGRKTGAPDRDEAVPAGPRSEAKASAAELDRRGVP